MKKLLIIILTISLSLSACAIAQPVASTLPASPTAAETVEEPGSGIPTVEPTLATLQLAVYHSGARTGLAEIDQVIDALLAHDFQAVKSLTGFLEVGCANVDGLGGPPRCAEGESEGTILKVIPFLGPEGYHLRAAEYESWSGPDVIGLLAVYQTAAEAWPDPNYPGGEFGLIFLLPGGVELLTLQVSEGKIVRFDYSYGGISIPDLESKAQEILLPLNFQPIPTPVPWGKFIDHQNRFSFGYPPILELSQEGSQEIWTLGDQIKVEVLPVETSWIACFDQGVGDCPTVETDEWFQVNGKEARRVTGQIGAVGGNVPQEFMTYVFPLEDQALVLTVYALPFDSAISGIDQIWPLQGMQLEFYQRTVETVQIFQ